jgi:tRNA 2-thiouridine synthesizing protein A
MKSAVRMAKGATPRICAGADHLLDLRGEVCPHTFVKTWLALEKLTPGELLCVLVDQGEPEDSVTRNVAVTGDEVLAVEREEAEQCTVLIRKGSVASVGSRSAP